MSELSELHADLLKAAAQGGEQAGQEAVQAGVQHVDNAGRALLNVETVGAHFAGPLEAEVVASQPYGITAAGPQLPGVAGTADVMADAAANAGVDALRSR